MNALKIAHLVIGAALLVAAYFTGTALFGVAGVILAAAGWLGLCPLARVLRAPASGMDD